VALRYADYSDPDEKALAAAALRSGIMPLDKRTLPGERAFAPTSGGILRHRGKVMTLTPSVRAISLCSLPCVARSSTANHPLRRARWSLLCWREAPA